MPICLPVFIAPLLVMAISGPISPPVLRVADPAPTATLAPQTIIPVIDNVSYQAYHYGAIFRDYALWVISQHLPPSLPQNFFRWPGNRDSLRGKSLYVIITTSTDSNLESFVRSRGTLLDSETSFTIERPGAKPNERQLFLFLLWDRLVDMKKIESDSKARDQAIANFIEVLAFNYFGPVQKFLAKPLGAPPDPLPTQQDAFQYEIEFLRILISSPFLAKANPTIQQTLRDRLSLLQSAINSAR